MKNFNFNNITSFKDFLNSLKEINNEYYKITLYNIKIDTFEENINFFGDLIFSKCEIKYIKGTFDFNRLFFNNCNKLCEINLFSSINSLIITNLNNRDKKNNKYDKLKIIGNYKNLNYFYFSAAYTQRNILFDGIFNNDEILNFIFYSNIINLKFKGFYNNILLSNTSRIFKDKRNCELDDFYDDIIINKLILNNYYNNISFDFNGFIIFDIIYDTINKFDNLINYINSDITLKDDNDKCKNITFGGYLLKKNNINTYNNLKSILCLNDDEITIEGNFKNLNKIFVKNANKLTLKGNFNSDILIDGYVDILKLSGNFKKIKNNGYIKKIVCHKSISGNFENLDNIECINCNYICGIFKNLKINNNKSKKCFYICNVLNNCKINKFENNYLIGNFYNLYLSNCSNLNLNNIFINNVLKINKCNLNLSNNFININELHISNSNIKELNDYFINLKCLKLNNCKNLINIPNTYINLEKIEINNYKKLLIDFNNYPNLKNKIGDY